MKYNRKLINDEISFGYMYVPAKGQKILPNINTFINVAIDNETTKLTYNADYNRIFGLTAWYKEKGLGVGSILEVSIEEELITIKPIKQQSIVTKSPQISTSKKRAIDLSNLSTGAKGNIIEDRIKELILLYGQGMLNVYKPVIDNEGIDLIVLKNGQFHSVFLQVKSRYNAYEKERLELTISKTFKAHNSFFVVGVSFNSSTMEIDNKVLFVSSKVVKENATQLKDGSLRITASLKETSRDIWQKHMVSKETMIDKILEEFAMMEKYIR